MFIAVIANTMNQQLQGNQNYNSCPHTLQIYQMTQQEPSNWLISAKNEYIHLVRSKQAKGNSQANGIYDWMSAELNLIDGICVQSQPFWKEVVEFQIICVKDQIQQFFSYFLLSSIIKSQQTDKITLIQRYIGQIKEKKLKYFQILNFIQLRQRLLKKISKSLGKDQQGPVFQNIDNIRLVNLEVISKIIDWRKEIQIICDQPCPIFCYNDANYLIKILNDNVQILNNIKLQKTKFISHPNPFFLSQDGNIQNMSQKLKTQIDECMDILKEEKIASLRMMITKPEYYRKEKEEKTKEKEGKTKEKEGKTKENQLKPKNRKSAVSHSQVKTIKQELLSEKQEQIKKIYQMNKSLSANRMNQNQEGVSKSQLRQAFQLKLGQIKLPNKRKEKIETTISYKSVPHKPTVSPIVSHAREESNNDGKNNQIKQKYGRDSFIKELNPKVPNKFEIKAPKPKIKLIQEKRTAVEDVIKATLQKMNISSISLKRKPSSTFYKSIQVIKQQNQDGRIDTADIKPITMTPKIKRQSITQYHFNPSKDSNKPSPLKKLTPVQQIGSFPSPAQPNLNNQLRIANSTLKNLTIINIYKQKNIHKRKNDRSESLSQAPSNHQNDSRILNTSEADLSRLTKRQQRKHLSRVEIIKTKSLANLDKLNRRKSSLADMHSSLQSKLQEKTQAQLKIAQEIEEKKKNILDLQNKINLMDNLKQSNQKGESKGQLQNNKIEAQNEKRKKQIENKVMRNQILLAHQSYIQSKQEQLRLKKQELQNRFQDQLKSVQNQCKTIQQEKKIKLQEEQNKVKEKQIELLKEQLKVQQSKRELEEELLREKLLKQILEEQQCKLSVNEEEEKNNAHSIEIEELMLKHELIEIQQKTLMLYEEEKLSLNAFYLEIQNQNRIIEEQNKQRLEEIFMIEQQKAQKNRRIMQLHKSIHPQFPPQHPPPQHQNDQTSTSQDMEYIRAKLRQQLLIQMKKKKAKEEQEQRKYEQSRQQRLKKIEQQIALIMQQREKEIQKYSRSIQSVQ